MKLPVPLAVLLIGAPLAQVVAAPAVEELMVTGSYSPVSSEQLAASVTVINQQQLQQLGGNSLVNALRQIPSLWVEEQGGPGGISSINLRGAEANHTLVLLNGVQLNDPTNTRGGAFDLNGINIETIERIEIIRGAQSAIYGSDALAGVIHIITRAPAKRLTRINARLGEKGYESGGIAATGQAGSLGYSLSAQSRDAGEPVRGSTASNSEWNARLDWRNEAHQLDLALRYFDGERTSYPEQSGGPALAQSHALDTSEYTDKQASLAWRYAINNFWRSSLSAGWYEREENYDSPGILPYNAGPPNGADNQFTRTTVSWVNTLGDQQRYWANLGLESKKEKGESQGYLDFGFLMPADFSLSRRTDSAFINLNGYVLPGLLIQASSRYDDPDSAASNTSSQAGVRYRLNDQWSFFANAGEGYKLPSFSALGHPLVGNADLKPETSTSRELGVDWAYGAVSANLTWFEQEYRNLIDFDSDTFRNVNRERVDTAGAEASVNWQVNTQLNWRVQGSYTDIDMLSSDNNLLGRPQSTLGSSLHYQPNADWQFNLNYLHVDERFAVSLHDGQGQQQTLDSYNRLDASAYWQFNPHSRLGLNLENLADADYHTDIGFPAPGRLARVSLDIAF